MSKRRLAMAKGTPKKDGSGGGTRKNKGRGGALLQSSLAVVRGGKHALGSSGR